MDINGNNGGILNIVHPGYPWFRFEFMGGKVHCVRVPRPGYGGATTAELIADDVHDVQAAKIAVGAFIIGYRMHVDEPVEFRGNGPRSYKLLCEGFTLGARLGGTVMVNRIIHLGKTPLVAAFTAGLGDIQSGAGLFCALRAYTAAIAATGTQNAIDIVDSGGSNAATIKIATTGFLDEAALATWIGLHGTASVAKVYDQSGNNKHLLQSTVANMPTITQSAIGSHSALTFNGSQWLKLVNGVNDAVADGVSVTLVATVTTSTGQESFFNNTMQIGFNNAGDNTWFAYADTVNSHAANNNAFHTAVLINNRNATSNFYVDGADDVADIGTSVPNGVADLLIGVASEVPSQGLVGKIMEVGFWDASLSANRAAMAANMNTAPNGYGF